MSTNHDADATLSETTMIADGEVRGAKRFWKSLDEVDGRETFEQFVQREYPSQSHVFQDPPQRREFLKLMGASLALAGVTAACTRQPKEKIYAYAKNPESTLPGKALYFATTMPWGAGALGLVVESHEGRPTKIEGNELHPSSLGATDVTAQATVLGLYDPQRSQNLFERATIRTWSDFCAGLKAALGEETSSQGAGVRILTGSVVSPTLEAQIQEVLKAYPKARWVVWEPVNRDHARRGAMMAFGRDVDVLPDLEKASVVLSLEADFLAGPEGVRNTKAFSKRRKVRAGGVVEMNRLYVAESAPSITGASADHRLAIRSSDVDAFARKVARALGVKNVGGAEAADARLDRFAEAVAKDLAAHKGASLVLAGASQPPHVHALAHAMNAALGNVGKTLAYVPPAEAANAGHLEGLQQLVQEMNSGAVRLLVVSDTNPVYTAPADLGFADALAKVKLRVHHGLYRDETALGCDWHVNAAHYLESWSDARAVDGTLSLVQPLIAPLYNGKTAHEVVAALVEKTTMSPYDIVREHWQKALGAEGFEAKWRRALHDGVLAGSAANALSVELQNLQLPAPTPVQGMELTFVPDPSIHDGRYALNGWLQELPKPLTKLTWDNVVQLSPATAKRLGIESGDVVELELAGRKVRGPAWIQPGQADDSVQIALGFGRTQAGSFATNLGFDAYQLRTSTGAWIAGGLQVRKTGDTIKLASTQGHDRLDVTPEGIAIEGRKNDVLRVGTIDRFRQAPEAYYLSAEEAAHHGEGHGEGDTSIYPKHARGEYAWGMVIDLNACTACNACVIACQSENNIPVVGKKEILRGREMHWIRIDRYFEGDRERPRIHAQPLPCMQCENAPCETVCPVAATSHGPEGLNEMTYNRCVGTRYCANNCPYKVRRFNFFLYSDYSTESLKLGRNPDVTVRSRGVMEKCTYCVQRINRARLAAHKQGRKVEDGAIVTACQQVCPADAIVFGNVDDPKSRVAALKAQPHNFGLLAELNTFPRTTYLGKVVNPNPELEPSA
ncbi:MAG: TAT-variant-translocated molybdopterin oxidoreductase [Planctomycetota bacterium]